jgi:hypothetical protein
VGGLGWGVEDIQVVVGIRAVATHTIPSIDPILQFHNSPFTIHVYTPPQSQP